ncbi:hypothetical protein HYZ97_03670 [Candidatus Pacearchaeota archaeon]|nr:hypothetical protein [Candidatus Pacearchaeota archaeon]
MSLFGIGKDKKIEKIEEVKEELRVSFNPFINKDTNNTSNTPITLPQTKIILPLAPPVLQIPSSPQIDDILNGSESQIKLSLAHDNALELLNRSVDILSEKLDDVRADRLPSVISAASKVVESIRKERNEVVKNSDREVHYHFYTPQQRKVEDYEVIDVTS